ncbi:MAG: putative rane protein [Acidimicrobiales bacterium]|nr:putative rane protein [Acidimicrobiales bacterium]
MDRSFEVDDIVGRPPTWSDMVGRGLRRRCPRCGGDDLFVHRFRLRDRCPSCGYRFEREPGFFLGAWFLNFMALESVHFVGIMAFIVWKSDHPGGGLVVPVIAAVVTSVALPILLYPWSQTVWAAIDLAMTPLELGEIVDAADAVQAGSGGDGRGRPKPH